MKTIWDMAPLCFEEGIISGEVVQIRPLHTVNGCQILLKVTDEPVTPKNFGNARDSAKGQQRRGSS